MDSRRATLLGTTVLLAALLVACAASPDQSPPEGDALLDNEWVLTSLNGDALIEGTQITLSFGEGTLEGSGGCNTYGGSYTATGDGLRLSDLYWTEMGCLEPQGILEQETAYLKALDTVATYQVNAGQLELTDEAGTRILVFGSQETELPDPATSAPGGTGSQAAEDSALLATIEAPESLPTGAEVKVRFTLTNVSSEGFFVLKWFTPLEGLAGDIFSMQRDGVDLPYQGKLVKRGAPVSEDYVWIDAGGSISAEVDLAEGYDFSQAGLYVLQFRSPRLSDTAKTSGEQAASFDELEAMTIPSDPVTLRIEGP